VGNGTYIAFICLTATGMIIPFFMADPEKMIRTDGTKEKDVGSDDSSSQDAPAIYERPTGIKGIYYHPLTQTSMLGLVCFMCPGLFNAVNGLGGGGQINESTGANSNAALYATFGVCAFFAGSINNKLGPRLTLQLGATGYSLYIGSYLSLNIHPNSGGFVVGAGAILGLCAGLLWTAQGSLMLGYPTEVQKGRYIGVFWGIFNLGAVLGSAIAFAQNYHSSANQVGNGTYIAFICLTATGMIIPFFMADPEKMIRTDGTKVTTVRHPSWKSEFKGLYIALRFDPAILLLFPMFVASNYFYTWQFNDFNGALFNIRTRALNSLVYWSTQIFGAIAIGTLLDQGRFPRRVRAFSGWFVLLIMVFIVHIWGYQFQKGYTRETLPTTRIDFKDKGYAAHVWLYIFCGLLDSMWQTTAYWLMGAMSNDPAKLAYLTGFYKSIQSVGAAIVWKADGSNAPYMNIFVSTWVLLAAGLLFLLPMIHLRVKDQTNLEDEVIARMDDSGNIQSVEKVKQANHRAPGV
jgi:MFS family permease